jgi:hypothetical protein
MVALSAHWSFILLFPDARPIPAQLHVFTLIRLGHVIIREVIDLYCLNSYSAKRNFGSIICKNANSFKSSAPYRSQWKALRLAPIRSQFYSDRKECFARQKVLVESFGRPLVQ